ncbi:MAG: DUF2306 domain-containing protein [Bacteroidota bacterium]
MLQITWQYIPINTDVAFLRIKQDYVRLKWYQIAFFTHVFGSIFVLLAGFTQFSEAIRINHYIVHRWSGWLYVAVVVGIAAPSGFLIGLCANGGWSAQLAFCLLAILWFIFTIIAVQKVLQKDITGHRRWMLRSFALAISAITLRAWKYILVALFHPRPMDVYRWVAWLGWVGNLLVVEWWIYRKEKSKM